MPNPLGFSDDLSDLIGCAELSLSIPDASVHPCGKRQDLKGYKMEHLTMAKNSDTKLRGHHCQQLQRLLGADSGSRDFNIDLYALDTTCPGLGFLTSSP